MKNKTASITRVLIGLTIVASLIGIFRYAQASVPWGAVNVAAPTASPTGNTYPCASFSSDPVCIVDMTTNVANLVLSGGTSGGNYTLVFMQDGTGGRTLTVPSNLVSGTTGVALPAIPSGANTYTVWTVQENSAGNYVVQGTFDNMNLSDVFSNTVTAPTSAITTAANLALTSVVLPGISTSNGCLCLPETWGTNEQKGISVQCIPTTNAATCQMTNASATTITLDAIVLQVREIK
jgi:hypothetical protein